MKNLVVNYQKASDPFWTDESGHKTQHARLFKHERLQERHAHSLFTKALRFNQQLSAFKDEVDKLCHEVYEQYMEDKNLEQIGQGKGNFTWYNFDRSIKVEMSISERITFDDLGIQASKELLNEFLDENLDSKIEVLKDMVNDAFSTSKGNLDTKKVMNLLRYEGKIKDAKFAQAMKILRDSIRKPSSKTYFRVWARTDAGDYQNIDLNFSSI